MNKEKRVNGQGTVFYNEGSKKWFAKIQYGTDNSGKPMIKSFTSKKSKAEVTKKLEEFKRKMLIGNNGSNRSVLNDYILNWLETYQKPKVKATTLHRDFVVFENHIRYTIGHMKLKDINTKNVQQLINSEKDRYAVKTIEKTYSLLNRTFKRAVQLKDLSINPCDGVALPNVHTNLIQPKEMEEYTTEETDAMEAAVRDSWENHSKIYRASPSYILLLNTGMRLGELLALRWKNVDLKNKLIRVRENQETVKTDGKRKTVTTLPKTKSSYRTIPINKKAYEMLMELKRRNEETKIRSLYVVSNLKGDSFNDNNYRRDFKRFCERYDIEYKGIHTFRHTFASRLFRNGTDVPTVSKLLGHSNTAITENIYIHILEEQKVKAIKLLDCI